MGLDDEGDSSLRSRSRWRRSGWAWIAIGGVLLACLLFTRIEITNPRVHVRWHEGISDDYRSGRERRYDLRDGNLLDQATRTWQYRLGTGSTQNIQALITDPAVVDTSYIDRDTLSADAREYRFLWYPFSDLVDGPSELRQLHQSAWLLLAGTAVLLAARSSSLVLRRNLTGAALLFVGAMAFAFPLDPSFVTMGGSMERAKNRQDFEFFYGGRVRFEKHLSQVILFQLYRRDPTDAAPQRALASLGRAAAVWFVLSALLIGFLERWSALALRYIGLALLAPTALLYFGWREFGYLSLSVASFPLLVRGLKDGGMRIEAGSAVAGFGAALHGTGLVSLAGIGLAALGASAPWMDRIRRALRVTAWGAAAYLGWVAVYLIVLRLPMSPDPGPAAFNSWRPWLVDEVRAGRMSAAIWSATGARDLLMTAWIVGAPLLLVAGSLWRRHAHEVRTALWYALPSLLFVIFRWPYDGVGGGMDLVVGGFPALYALAWVCAHDSKRTNIAAVILVSAHYAFWRVILDENFIP